MTSGIRNKWKCTDCKVLAELRTDDFCCKTRKQVETSCSHGCGGMRGSHNM